jgi:delta24-sterol reductase
VLFRSPKVLKVTQTEELRQLYEKFHVVQDMLVPMRTLEESLKVFDEQFMVYPLWLCPMAIFEDRGAGKGGFVTPKPANQPMYIDIGGYGVPKVKNFDATRCCRCATHITPALCRFPAALCLPGLILLVTLRRRAVEAHVIKV